MIDVFLDIETIPEQPEKEAKARIAETIKAPAKMTKKETVDAWHDGVGLNGKYAGEKEKLIDEKYRSGSLDGARGEICVIGWGIEDGKIEAVSQVGIGEAKMIKFFFDTLLIQLDGKDPRFIGHWVAGFDLKFIWQRAVVHNITPPFRLPFKGRHFTDYFCTQTEWCGYKDRISADNLAKALGIEGKTDMDGSKVWDAWRDKEAQKVFDYCLDDVRMVREIYNRMQFNG